jgi:hypothetical protein
MESQLYIRIRGRVLGPYDQEKLQSLARRGQLSRMHELSPDATNWVRASTYPELFVMDDVPPTMVAPPGEGGRSTASVNGHAPPAAKRWWYRRNGAEAGPVDPATLQQMLAAGNLGLDDIVWTEGMVQWLPARQVPGLTPVAGGAPAQAAGGGPIAGATGGKDELPATLCSAARSSYPWVEFVAVVSFICAGISIVAGIFALIHGANVHLAPVVAWGLFALIWGVDVAAGGFILSTYGRRVASLKFSAHPVVLETALNSLRTLWIYLSINLIVILAIVVFTLVWFIAVTGTISFPGL